MKITHSLVLGVLAVAMTPTANAATLDVTVVNSSTGQPVVGAYVYAGVDGSSPVARTDSQGKAAVTASGSGPWTVTAIGWYYNQPATYLSSVSVATTVQGLTATSATVALGPYQALFGGSSSSGGSSAAVTVTGSVSGLDTSSPTQWVVRTGNSSTYGTVATDSTSYSVSAPGPVAGFVAASQVPIASDGTYDLYAVPERFAIAYDVADGTQDLVMGPGFERPVAFKATGLGDEAVLCPDYTLVLPDGRGLLNYAAPCGGAGVSSTSLLAPSLTGSLANGDLNYSAVAYGPSTEQYVGRGHLLSASSVTLDLPPVAVPQSYSPLSVETLPGVSLNFSEDDDALREIVVVADTQLGPGGHMYATSIWTLVNLDPAQMVTFPRLPRKVPFPAPGNNAPTQGSQTAVAILEFPWTDLEYAASVAYLQTVEPTTEAILPLLRFVPSPSPAVRSMIEDVISAGHLPDFTNIATQPK